MEGRREMEISRRTERSRRTVYPKTGEGLIRKKLLIFIACCFALGLIFGAILLRNSDISYLDKLLYDYTAASASENKLDSLVESVVKYGKHIVFIWLAGVFPVGAIITALLVFIKGLGLGLSVSLIITSAETPIGDIFRLIVPQNLFLLPAYTYLAYYSLRFIISNYKKTTISKSHLLNYFLVLLIGIACVFAAAFVECYIV